ncbi:MAG: hypothetical protein OXU45_05225 [Candidatus Melainabacteria bacterium]|nr:hypothetical protein [Candidatus Melainabacteria bacterium]
MSAERKLKSLALILRSLPPATQKTIFEQLPLPLVQRISDVDLTIDETLSQDDWDYFANTWPEFYQLIDNVRADARKEKSTSYLETERPRVKEYIQYRLGETNSRPKLSHALAKIIDEQVLEEVS